MENTPAKEEEKEQSSHGSPVPFDDVLRKMLNTPPQHVKKKDEKLAKKPAE